MEGGLIVLARLLVLSDFHKKYKDPSSIKGLLNVQQKIQEEVIAEMERYYPAAQHLYQ